MKILFLVVSIIAFVSGILLLFAPGLLIKVGNVLNQVFTTDEVILSRRLLFGILLIIVGIFMIYRFLLVV